MAKTNHPSTPLRAQKFSFTLLKRILSYSKPYKNLFAAAIVITLTLSSLSIVRPLLIKQTLNTIAIVDSNEKGFLSSPDKIDFINHIIDINK